MEFGKENEAENPQMQLGSQEKTVTALFKGIEVRKTKTGKNLYSYRVEKNGKDFFMSGWKDYFDLFGKDVVITYIERENPKNQQYPYKNVLGMVLAVQGEVQGKSLLGTQLEATGVVLATPTADEAEIMNRIAREVGNNVSWQDFRATLEQLLGTGGDRASALWQVWQAKTK